MVEDFKQVPVASGGSGRGVPSSVALSSSGNRASERSTLVLVARLRLEGEHDGREVRVRNLSEGGLMLEFDRPLDVGTSILLDLDGVGAITGKVAWCTQGRVGVALDAMIDPEAVRGQGG